LIVRYRKITDANDLSNDAAVVCDFIGEEEYRRSFERLRESLNLKGFVTAFDDAQFGLELQLFNLERMRERSQGRFPYIPAELHEGTDFLIGLAQTIPTLSAAGKAKLLGQLKKGFQEGLWPLQHELRVAASLSNRGCDIQFHDLEDGSGYDFLAEKDGLKFEVEAKAVSAFTGWPIKPEDLNRFAVEVREHFEWEEKGIPVFRLELSSGLPHDRPHLQTLISTINGVGKTRTRFSSPDVAVQLLEIMPTMSFEQLSRVSYAHARLTGRIVIAPPMLPRVMFELSSKQPVTIERKIVKLISETAKKQFTRERPAVIWTHVKYASLDVFNHLSASKGDRPCLFDRVSNACLLSEKRNHLCQLVYSGGSILRKAKQGSRSSYEAAVYNSSACRFGDVFIFPANRKKRQ
jgi:hypothetical protein